MQDIASAMGVSVMTVSRALRGVAGVSEKTALKVRERAIEMGYKPNPMVQTLMAQVRRGQATAAANLAWVTTCGPEKQQTNPTIKIQQGARNQAEKLGYNLTDFIIEPGMTEDHVRKIFHARGIRGGVIAPLIRAGAELPLPYSDFAYAAIGRSLARPALHYTMAHHYHLMEKVVTELTARGYQRIGFLFSSDMALRVGQAHLMVFDHFIHGLPKRRVIPSATYDKWEAGDFAEWADRNAPDACIIDYPFVWDHIQAAGLMLGGDFGVVALSWWPSHPHVTGIRHHYKILGSAAVDMVVGQLHRNECGVPKICKATLIEGQWMEGETLRQPCEKSASTVEG